jgi:RNA polymerase sigma-70 factor (ECF subfamily)
VSHVRERFEREAVPEMRRLRAAARALTRNAADAEDLVQETYLRAFRAFASYATDTNIRGWLFTILYRARADALRKAGRRVKTVALAGDVRALVPPHDAVAARRQEVSRALAALPDAFRTAVLLRDVQDFSYEEIGRILAIPLGTVMSRIHRGRRLLRRSLGERRAAA